MSNPFDRDKSEEATSDKQEVAQPVPAGDHLHFQPGIDFEDVTELFKMVREGTLMDNKVHALDKALWLAGGLNAYFDSHQDPAVFETIAVPNEFEGEGGLEQVLGEELDRGATALNPKLAAFLKKLALMVLEALLAS